MKRKPPQDPTESGLVRSLRWPIQMDRFYSWFPRHFGVVHFYSPKGPGYGCELHNLTPQGEHGSVYRGVFIEEEDWENGGEIARSKIAGEVLDFWYGSGKYLAWTRCKGCGEPKHRYWWDCEKRV